MSHECEDCGETFETLSRLRLHDCSPATAGDADRATAGSQEHLDDHLAAVEDGDFPALHQAMAEYTTALEDALAADDGETYRDVFWEYYEPLADGLDRATRAEGWSFLRQFADAYAPAADEDLPPCSPVVENAVGRHLIRTRYRTGVDAVPVEALEYLASVIDATGEGHDVELEEAHAYGWGIGHPEHAVADRLRASARDDIFFVNAALEHAFYADQRAAVDLLEELVDDDAVRQTVSYISGDISETRYLLDAPAGAASQDFWPQIPRYWDWREDLEFEFELDDDVEGRIRAIATAADIDDELSEDWTIPELAL